MKKTSVLYECYMILCVVCWGLCNPIVKVGYQTAPAYLFSVYRFIASFLIFAVFAGKRIVKAARTNNFRHALLISFFNGLAYFLGNISFNYGDATVCSFLISTSVVFTPFVARVVLKKRMKLMMVPIIAVALVGLYLVCGNSGEVHFGTGELISLGCAVSTACAFVCTAKYSEEMDLSYLAALQCIMALLFSLPFYFLYESYVPIWEFDRTSLLCLAFAVLIGTCLTFLLQNLALRRVEPTVVSITCMLESILTAIFAHFLLQESLSGRGFAGGGLILLSVLAAILLENGIIGKKEKTLERTGN